MSIVQYKRQGAVTADGALDHLARVADSGKIEVESIAGLGRILGWSRPRASKALKQWQAAGAVTVDRAGGKLVVQIVPGVPTVPVTVPADRAEDRAEARSKRAGDRSRERRADRSETSVEDIGNGTVPALQAAREALARIAQRAGAEHRAAVIEPDPTVPLPALPDLSGMPREMSARMFEAPATVSTVPAVAPLLPDLPDLSHMPREMPVRLFDPPAAPLLADATVVPRPVARSGVWSRSRDRILAGAVLSAPGFVLVVMGWSGLLHGAPVLGTACGICAELGMLLLSFHLGRTRLPLASRLKLQAVVLGLVGLSFVGGHREVKVLYEGAVPAHQEQLQAALAGALADEGRDRQKIADVDRQVAAIEKRLGDAVSGLTKPGHDTRDYMAAAQKEKADLSAQRARLEENLAAMVTQTAQIRAALANGRLDPGPLKAYLTMAGVNVSDESALEFWLTLVVICFGPAAAAVLSTREGA